VNVADLAQSEAKYVVYETILRFASSHRYRQTWRMCTRRITKSFYADRNQCVHTRPIP